MILTKNIGEKFQKKGEKILCLVFTYAIINLFLDELLINIDIIKWILNPLNG